MPFPDCQLTLTNFRFLIVDPDDDTREMLTFLFECLAATVITTASPQEALVLLESYRPHVVLSELKFPDGDGYRLVQQTKAKRDTQYRNIVAIAVSSSISSQEQQRALAVGFDRFVAKPIIDLQQFVAAIVELLMQD